MDKLKKLSEISLETGLGYFALAFKVNKKVWKLSFNNNNTIPDFENKDPEKVVDDGIKYILENRY